MVGLRSGSGRAVLLVLCTVVLFGALAWKLIAPGGPAAVETEPPRCVVLITIDTLRADVLGAYGATGVKTPAIDRLAEASTVFERAYAPTPWTKPSIATLFTGLDPSVHGLTAGYRDNDPLPPTVKVLAERMREAGFETGALGFNPYCATTADFRRGFRDFFVLPHDDRTLPTELTQGVRQADPTDAIAGLADRWMEQQRDRPFFLWLHFYDPHVPYRPPKAFWTDSHRANPNPREVFDMTQETRPGPLYQPPDEERRQLRGLYESEVQYVDSAVGRVIASLKRLGLYDDALIVLTSDHGEEFWDHGSFEHGHTLYDELLHVPLIVRTPRARPRRVTERVGLDSVFATLLDACGAPGLRDDAIAPSLWPSVVGATAPPTSAPMFAAFNLYWEQLRSVRFDRYKFIEGALSKRIFLYDVVSDPAERHSLADQRPDLVKRARTLLDRHDAQSAATKARLAISTGKGTEIDAKRKKLLKSHGYVK